MQEAGPPPSPFRPIGIGILLLSPPLFITAFLAPDTTACAASVLSGGVLVILGLLCLRAQQP